MWRLRVSGTPEHPSLRDGRPRRLQCAAFWTLPALMQDVHTCIRLGEPFTRARMRWMFGFQRRLVRMCEWLIRMPKEGCLPHTSHTAAMTRSLNYQSTRDGSG